MDLISLTSEHLLETLNLIGVVLGLCRDTGKENGNYYLGFRV